MTKATVPHGQGPGSSCLVCAVLARVPAGPRRAPAQPRRHHGRRLGHVGPAAGGATPGPASATTAAARAPALPGRRGRQEAPEPVPLHSRGDGLNSAPALRPVRPGSAQLGPTRLRPARLRPTRLRPARLGTARPAGPRGRTSGASRPLRGLCSFVSVRLRRSAPQDLLEAGRGEEEGRGEGGRG